MPKIFLLIFTLFIFSFFFLFSINAVYAQTMTLSPSTITARDENGINIIIKGLITDLEYTVVIQKLGDLFPSKIGVGKPDPSGAISFKLCGDKTIQNNCLGRDTFNEGKYEIKIRKAADIGGELTKKTLNVEPATSDITIDFLNTSWTTSDEVVVKLGKVSDGNYLITVNDKDPNSGGGCFGVNGGSATRNLGKYFEGSYVLRIYDNGGGFPNPLCSKGSQVGETTPFTIKSDGTGGPGKAIPPQTVLKIHQFDGDKVSSAGKFCNNNQGLETAIGCVPTDPTAFVQGFLKLAVGAGGGIALLIMVFGAFRMITSAGNPDSLKEGHDMFINAVIGLLFVIFSTLLLKIIGVDILGLGRFLGI
ncbi:hypothetical protein HYS92_00055 [Candidatus Daviesbacteria bacterium]|nr:hypothetical protein [Candidatus Daviesbacteria bacterium]